MLRKTVESKPLDSYSAYFLTLVASRCCFGLHPKDLENPQFILDVNVAIEETLWLQDIWRHLAEKSREAFSKDELVVMIERLKVYLYFEQSKIFHQMKQ